MHAAGLPAPHRGAGGHELQHLLAPDVHLHPQLDADDAVGAEVVGLGAHPGHRQLPGAVHRLGQDLQLLVLRPAAHLEADVVDRRADHEAQRLEPGLAQQHVLRHRQVRGEDPGRAGPGGLREPAVGGLRLPAEVSAAGRFENRGMELSFRRARRRAALAPAAYRRPRPNTRWPAGPGAGEYRRGQVPGYAESASRSYWEAPVIAGPGDAGDKRAAVSADRGLLRASHADRERVIDTLKIAFVQGRFTKDEFDAGWARRSRRGPTPSWRQLPTTSRPG